MGSMVSSLERREWIPVQEMVPQDSIGSVLISGIPTLGERFRPKTILNQPVTILLMTNSKSQAEIADGNFQTVADFLKLPSEQFTSLRFIPKIREKLESYLEGLLKPPQTKLLQAVFKRSLTPPLPGREQEIVEGVEDVLNKMSYRRAIPVLISRFGLYDGITNTLEQTGELFGRTRSRVQQIETKGLMVLRQLPYSGQLRLYLTMPEASLGRLTFGALLGKDLPQLDENVSIHHLGLSSGILEELTAKTLLRAGSLPSTILDLVMEDLSLYPSQISDRTKDEIVSALHRRIREVADRPRREAKRQAQVKQARRERLREPSNNLIPEIVLTPQQLEVLDNILLEELGLLTRCYNALRYQQEPIETIGELLRKNRSELLALRNFGKKSVDEVLVKVVRLLTKTRV